MRGQPDLRQALRDVVDPMEPVQRVVDQACGLVGAEGALIGLVHDSSVAFICGSGFLRDVAEVLPIGASLVGLAVTSGTILRCDDTAHDPRVNQGFAAAHGVASVVCVPLRRRSETVGVLTVNSSRPRAFDDADVRTLTRLAEFVGVVIAAAADLTEITNVLLSSDSVDRHGDQQGAGLEGAGCEGADPEGAGYEGADGGLGAEARFVANILRPGSFGGIETRHQIEGLLEGRRLRHQFQPIFDLWSGKLFGVEGLARVPIEPARTPDVWFDEAYAVGLGLELEIASLRAALASLPHLPEGTTLCVNAGPEVVGSDDLYRLLEGSDPGRVVIELTEQVPVDDYGRLAESIGRLRSMGARLAIDDTGAGFASLAHILKLDPDLIKLDRALTTGIDADPVRRALAAALVNFAAQTRAQIVAEGIETADELAVLCDLGVRYGQGYLLGRPAAVASIPHRPAQTIPAKLKAVTSLDDLLALGRRD